MALFQLLKGKFWPEISQQSLWIDGIADICRIKYHYVKYDLSRCKRYHQLSCSTTPKMQSKSIMIIAYGSNNHTKPTSVSFHLKCLKKIQGRLQLASKYLPHKVWKPNIGEGKPTAINQYDCKEL